MNQSIYSFFEVRFFSNDKSLKVEGLIITFTCQFKIVIEWFITYPHIFPSIKNEGSGWEVKHISLFLN